MAKRKPKAQPEEPTDVVEETPSVPEVGTEDEQPPVDLPEVGTEDEQPPVDLPEVGTEDEQPQPEELDVTEDPEIQDEVEKIIASDGLSDVEVNDVLSHPDMDAKDKITKIAAEGTMEFRMTAATIVSYIEAVDESKPFVSAANIANKNYNIYNAIRQVVNTEDQANFKTKMRILTHAFVAHKDGAFNEFKLHRYDYAWTWGDKALKTYQHLIVLFTSLSDLATRQDEIKKLDMNAVLDPGAIDLPVDTCDRLKRYFS